VLTYRRTLRAAGYGNRRASLHSGLQHAFDPEIVEGDDNAKCYRSPMPSPEEKQKLIELLCGLPDDSVNEYVVEMVEKLSGGALSPRGEVVACLLGLPREERRPLAEQIADGINPSDRELYGPYLFEEDELERDNKPSEEIQAAWDDELARRMEELDNGTVKAIPWSEVQERLNKKRAELRAKARR
jgi:putative addiction module component (TIGR02574 family)